jgi:hypothetical protein
MGYEGIERLSPKHLASNNDARAEQYTRAGGPAFPVLDERGCIIYGGMTLRDYFAAKAMQALAADTLPNEVNPETGMTEAAIVARSAYWIADAMLKARDA